MPVQAEQVAGGILAHSSMWPRPQWQNAASRQVGGAMGAPTGLRELNLRRGSAPLEIALQRGVSLGAALWPPSCGSGLEWLQVLDAGVCEGDSDGRGSRLETEPPGREPGSAGPCCRGSRARAHQFSWVCPGRTSIWLSPSLFIRGVNNPYIVFLLLDYFVFV